MHDPTPEGHDPHRLEEIERALVEDDQRLAEVFRDFAGGGEPVPQHETVVPAWMSAVFLTAMASWTLGPGLGALTAAAAAWWLFTGPRRAEPETVPEPPSDDVAERFRRQHPRYPYWPGWWR